MNCVHLTQSISTLGGGISEVVRALSLSQQAIDCNATVMSLKDGGEAISPWPEGSPKLLKSVKIPGMRLIPELSDCLDEFNPDLLHTHGLWTYISVGVPRWSKRNNRPYVVSPHGMLDAWALQRSSHKKKLAARLYENKHLSDAACLHALCQSEADSIRAYGIDVPVAVIPNGVQLPSAVHPASGTESGTRMLLFLGRIHPKKGLENALRAWAKTDHKKEGWHFVIAGWDQEQHEKELKNICDELGILFDDIPIADYLADSAKHPGEKASVVFTGSVFGDAKDELLKLADAFILPSFSEGLPISVLEAWAYHLPVLMTDHCNLPEGFEAGAAIRVGTDVESLAVGVTQMMEMPKESRLELGTKGFDLVTKRFTWEQIAKQMDALYRWILKRGDKPGFVETI